jgi:hypothetical protein
VLDFECKLISWDLFERYFVQKILPFKDFAGLQKQRPKAKVKNSEIYNRQPKQSRIGVLVKDAFYLGFH